MINEIIRERKTETALRAMDTSDIVELIHSHEDAQKKLEAQRDRFREALERYADPINWGYYDESGCAKGEGKYEDACFIGPAIARKALAEQEVKR